MSQKEQMSLNKLVTVFGTEIPFVRLLSILSLLGVGLFFVGWVYRWAYFSFFQLQINTINLSPQSFLFSPLQVFFSDSSRTFLTIGSLLTTGICIYLVLWLYNLLITQTVKAINFWEIKLRPRYLTTPSTPVPTSIAKKILKYLKSPPQKLLFSLLRFGKTRAEPLQMLQGLIEELIAVSLVILVFYWLARTQGLHDARRDASPKSTLPAIAFITKEGQFPIGIKLDNPLAVPPVKGFTIIGDRGMFKSLQDRVDTDITDPKNPRVWRLLIEQNGWFYLFYNLPANASPDRRPLVIALKESQMLILSPEP